MPAPRHIFRIHIRATPAEVWRAITDPAFTRQYFHGTEFESSLEPGDRMRYVTADGRDAVVGEIEVSDPPRRLVTTWRALYDPELAAEPASRVEWLLTDNGDGVTQVTTIHRDLGQSPATSASVGDGWIWILGSLKSLLETGTALSGEAPEAPAGLAAADEDEHRTLAVDANGAAWELLERDARSPGEDDDLLERAYAAAYHWRRAAGRRPEHDARAAWLVARVHAVLSQGEQALHHAERCAAIVAAAGLGDFDLAYAHEARARALACLGRVEEADAARTAAVAVPIADAEDRAVFDGDLAAGPWFALGVAPHG